MFKVSINNVVLTLATLMSLLHISAVVAASANIRTYKILEGDNLLIMCNVTENPDIDVYWTKNETKSQFLQLGKRLEILKITRKYSGDYVCHALNTSFPVQDYNETDVNKTIEVIKVDVQYPGEINTFYGGPYEVMENETFSITCDFQANPYPTWSIRNRDTGYAMITATLPGFATVTSPPAICDYTGYWECTGRNKLNHGVNVTRGQNITVFCPPRPQFGKNEYSIKATVGHSAQLKMSAQANPRAKFTWFKDDGTDLSTIAVQNDYLDETNLTFSPVSVPCFGTYTLKMENKYGINFAHYQITADGPPETPTNFHYSDVTYDSVRLRWTSGFDMGSRQHFIVMKLIGNQFIQVSDTVYDNSPNHGINQTWTYKLDGLVSNTEYNLTVVALNDRGLWSAFAKPSIKFRTKHYPDVFSNDSPTNLRLILGILLGTLGTLGFLAFIVYMVKYRRMRTSYDTVSEKKAIIQKC
ncbi:hemicentin-1-like [Ruditapes philippinarum]|uniref:hemicentin-1-like n=1 Tax=Ruditapes philippinarum TaxID=129788 RepID=UPI00295A8EFA|nr:hemicentin-1-like [Ruditapes philippinarum]